ncbi:hypothetical protein N7522_006351 [Penicillium canescens]|nr:hypothetical protein N7522_006351 [Penicillium canescens]
MGASKLNNLNKVKVLMLHGHNQSGLFFRYKTVYLEKILKKKLQSSSAFSDQLAVEFEYPSGPLHADPDCPLEGSSDRWAWGHGDHQTDRIKGIENSIRYILQYLHEKGPFIGIMGFSSGAALAAIVTSLLERRNTITGMDLQINHPSLSFLVCFSGFKLNHAFYKTVYREKIQTPTLIVIGEVDTMIFPSETLQLMQQSKKALWRGTSSSVQD